MVVGTITALWRYPVKSMLGERLTEAEVEMRGVRGDRLYAVRTTDGKLGSGKSSRRFRRITGLLDLRARYADGGRPAVVSPDGPVGGDEELRRFLGRDDVALEVESDVIHYDAAPLHLLTTASIGAVAHLVPEVAVDERRFRPNIVLDTGGATGFVEDDWVGRTASVGPELRISFSRKTGRCGMTMMAQEELPHSSQVLRTIIAANEMNVGIYATVLTPGTMRLGDELVLD